MAERTYIFRDGQAYTMEGDRVVAKVALDEFGMQGENENPTGEPVEMPPPPAELGQDPAAATCADCGGQTDPGDQFCAQCGSPVSVAQEGQLGQQGGPDVSLQPDQHLPPRPMVANTITTPNGLKGKILGKTATVWGEEVTVRFENGVIKRIPVTAGLKVTREASAPDNSAEALDQRLAESFQSDRESLVKRRRELESIMREARSLEAEDSVRIAGQANHEAKEVDEALSHLAAEDAESYEPFASPADMPAADQASHGGSDTWLDKTLASMQAEVAATDFEKLMDEGPEAFVAALDDTQLADAGTTRSMASYEVRSFTAGSDEKTREKFERVWLARVEEQRKTRLASRKQEVRKQASEKDTPVTGPDEGLFL